MADGQSVIVRWAQKRDLSHAELNRKRLETFHLQVPEKWKLLNNAKNVLEAAPKKRLLWRLGHVQTHRKLQKADNRGRVRPRVTWVQGKSDSPMFNSHDELSLRQGHNQWLVSNSKSDILCLVNVSGWKVEKARD